MFYLERHRELEPALITQAGNNAITCKRLKDWRMTLRQELLGAGVGGRCGEYNTKGKIWRKGGGKKEETSWFRSQG